MATEIEVTFAKSQSLPDTVPEGRLQLVDESASATEVEAYVGTQNGTKKITDKDKASIEALKDGTLVPKLADNMTPYSEDSGIKQTQPFFLEGTATGNGESRVDAKQVPAYAFLQEKRGNMVCVNQLYGGDSDYTETLGTGLKFSYSASTGLVTLNGTSTSLAQEYTFGGRIVKGHNNLAIMRLVSGSFEGGDPRIMVGGSGAYSVKPTNSPVIINVPTAFAPAANLQFFANADSVFTNAVFQIIFVDLTQWFNGNIPAYLLSHPEAFGRYYKGSLAYEPGRLEPATGRYLTSVGRNIWDEEWEVGGFDANGNLINTNTVRSKNFIDVSGITEYYFKCPNDGIVLLYDENKTLIPTSEYTWQYHPYINKNSAFTVTPNAKYMRFCPDTNYGATYKHDITISEYYPGESGYDKYYPHEVLATIDTGSEDLGTFDVKLPSGLIERNTGEYTFNGTENWIQSDTRTAGGMYRYYLNKYDIDMKSGTALSGYCNKFVNAGAKYNTTTQESVFFGYGNPLFQYLSSTEKTQTEIRAIFNSSVTIQYPLTDSAKTTEQGTPFQETVPIDDFGQLSWSNTDVPQGNQIFYPVDYKAYEDTLIKYTDGDATSLVRKTDYASSSEAGVVQVPTYNQGGSSNGILVDNNGRVFTSPPIVAGVKSGVNNLQPLTSYLAYAAVFYGLSRAAGVNLASSTAETAPDGTNPGIYPAAAKSAIQNMLGITDLIGDINTVLDSVNGVVI